MASKISSACCQCSTACFVSPSALWASPRFREAVALATLVADFSKNDQHLLVVLDGLANLTQGEVRIAQVPEAVALAASVADSREMTSACSWYLMASRTSPREKYVLPRFPRWLPSPRRSPISREMTSACS